MTDLIESSTAIQLPYGEPADRSWTREEYDRLTDMGFFEGQRLELIEGRIIQMAPQRVPHSIAMELLERFTRRGFLSGHRLRWQLPFLAADGSEPEPDLAVVVGDDPRVGKEHPSTAALIVEISDTTLRHDRHKARLYAASKVADYWIINLNERTLELYRDPLPGGGPKNGPAYGAVRVLDETASLSPLAAAHASVVVADLLP